MRNPYLWPMYSYVDPETGFVVTVPTNRLSEREIEDLLDILEPATINQIQPMEDSTNGSES